jgi:ABC-2 type transport system ATP-binding protein
MIRVSNLAKYYGGKRALGPVSFEIEDGETVGFLGLNGAGKTTALRILACDLRPSAGTVVVDGVDAVADAHEVKKRIGFLPEAPPLYGDMTVIDYLRFAAELRGMRKAEITKRLPQVLDLTHLGDVAGDPIHQLSHGFKQRVGVAQAIVHNPKLLILDEPTRGLDPRQIVEMRNMIHGLKQHHTVLISSHILPEISQTCDRLVVIGGGRILGVGTEDELSVGSTEVREAVVGVAAKPDVDDPQAAMIALLEAVPGVTKVTAEDQPLSFLCACERDVRADLGRAVVNGGWDLLRLDYTRSELENTFIRLVGGGDARN